MLRFFGAPVSEPKWGSDGGLSMRMRLFALLFSVACLLTLSAPVWASSLSTSFTLLQQTKIQNVNLKPGDYRLVVDESSGKVKIESRHQVVAHVNGKWVTLSEKASESEVLTNNNTIQEVTFAGKNRALKFGS